MRSPLTYCSYHGSSEPELGMRQKQLVERDALTYDFGSAWPVMCVLWSALAQLISAHAFIKKETISFDFFHQLLGKKILFFLLLGSLLLVLLGLGSLRNLLLEKFLCLLFVSLRKQNMIFTRRNMYSHSCLKTHLIRPKQRLSCRYLLNLQIKKGQKIACAPGVMHDEAPHLRVFMFNAHFPCS